MSSVLAVLICVEIYVEISRQLLETKNISEKSSILLLITVSSYDIILL